MPKPLLVHWLLWNQNRVPTETFEGFHKSVVPEHTRFVPMTEWIPDNILRFLFCFCFGCVYLDLDLENESNADVDKDETEMIAGVPRRIWRR